MGLLSKLFGGKGAPPPPPPGGESSKPPEHAVILHIRLGNDEFGTPDEVASMHALEDELASAIKRARAGEHDGDEFGQGECVIYCYGPDADKLWNAVAPVLEPMTFRAGSYVVRRYGPPGSREDRIDLHWEG